jgi:hypothetical protein
MQSAMLDAVRVVVVSAATTFGSNIAHALIDKFVGNAYDAQLIAAIAKKSRAGLLHPPVVNTASLADQKFPFSLQRGDQIPDAYAADLEIARNNIVNIARSMHSVAVVGGADYLSNSDSVRDSITHKIQSAFGVSTYEALTNELENQAWRLKLLAASNPASNSATDQLSWLSNMNMLLSELATKATQLAKIHDEVTGSADVAQAVSDWQNAVASLRDQDFVGKLWYDLSTQTDPERRLTDTQAILNSPQCTETINRAVSMGKIKAEDVAGLKMGKIHVVRLASKHNNNAVLFDSGMDAKCTKVTMALLSSGCYTDLARNLGKKYNHNQPIGTVKHQPYTYCDFNGQSDKFERVLQYEVINRVINGTADHRDFAFEFLTGLGFPPPPPPPQRPSSSFVHVPTPRRIQPSETAQLSTAGAPGDPDKDPPGGGSSTGEWKKHGISPWNRGAIAISGLFAAEQVPRHIQTALNSTNTTPLAIRSAINSNSTLSSNNITEAIIKETVHHFEAEAKVRSHWMMEMLNGFMGSDLTTHASHVFAFATTWLCLRWATQRATESICRRAGLPVPSSNVDSDLARFAYLISEFVPSAVTYYLLVVLCGVGSMGIGQYLGALAVVLPIVSILWSLLRATTTNGQSNNNVDLRGAKGLISVTQNVNHVYLDGVRRRDLEQLLQGKDAAALAIEPITNEEESAITELAARHGDQLMPGQPPSDAAHVDENSAALLMITAEDEEITVSVEFEAILAPDKAKGNNNNNSLMALLALASA